MLWLGNIFLRVDFVTENRTSGTTKIFNTQAKRLYLYFVQK